MSAFVYFACITTLMSGALSQQKQFLELFQQNEYKMEFERADAVRYDNHSMKFFEVRTFKYNRTCTAVNVTFEFNVDIGRDLEIITQAYAFLSNEYRLFPMRFQMNFCGAISKNYGGYGGFGKCGNFKGCPLTKGKRYHFCNFTPDQTQLPPLVPNGRYLMELQGVYQNEEIFVLRTYGRVYRPIVMSRK